jgi:GH18 family chitinase
MPQKGYTILMERKGLGREATMKRTSIIILLSGLILIAVLANAQCQGIRINAETDSASPPIKLDKVVMGYYATWKRAEFDHTKINYRYLTHIAESFTMPDSEGNLVVEPEFIYPELIDTAHVNGVKVIMSIGGWGNCEGFPGMAATPETRTRFITQVLEFCQKYHYDGVDIDWEFVSTPQDQLNFVLFIKELSTALKSQVPPMQLSLAVPAGDFYGHWINFEELTGAFDFIGFMTYDFHEASSDHYLYARSRQVPNEKLLLGVPFYGHSFDCRDLYMPFKTCDGASYSEVMTLRSSGWKYIWDDCAQVPYIRKPDGSEIISYDDVRSVQRKCLYIKEKEAAGIIIWELSDDYVRGKSELLNVIGASFQRRR